MSELVFDPQSSGPQIVTPGSGTAAQVVQSDISRTLPRQISSGNYRGNQTITGTLNVTDSASGLTVISTSGPNQQELFTDPISKTNYMVIGKFSPTDNTYGVKIAKPGFNVLTASDSQLIFNSNQDVLKVVATQTVTVASLTASANTSGSSSATIDLSAYPTNSIILPIALASNQPSFVWQGMHGLSGTVVTGTAGWQIVADYSTTFTSGGIMQLTRTLINASSGSYTDSSYTITIYVLQETVS